MNNSFFSRFTPKEPKFYVLLTQMAQVSRDASKLITECVKNIDHDDVIDYAKKIKLLEKKGDELLGKVFDELNSTFITPFDREDIHDLANCLDDVMDYINSCAKRITLYKPKRMPESAYQLALLVDEASECVYKAVKELESLKKNAKTIKKDCNELHDLENKADEVYEDFIYDLFDKETDSIEVIKLKEIMHELEKATDAAEGVGKIIKTIIVKYA